MRLPVKNVRKKTHVLLCSFLKIANMRIKEHFFSHKKASKEKEAEGKSKRRMCKKIFFFHGSGNGGTEKQVDEC